MLGLLAFALNGSLLTLALWLIPDGRGTAAPETAVLVAAVMSAVASATGTALAVRDDNAYRRRLYRLSDRRRRRALPVPATPGTVFLQLDGVGHDVLASAVARGLLPTVARWLGHGTAPATHRLTPWRTDWSSQTGASQLGILHGTTYDIPAFRWYEKERRQVMVSNRPASAAELQRRAVRRTGNAGLLADDGASRGNLFSGGAGQVALVLSVSARRERGQRSRSGYFAYFSDPANAVRTAMSFVAEVLREMVQSTRSRLRGDTPRVGRAGLYPFVRAFATVVERDVVVAAVMGDMLVKPHLRLRRPGRLRRGRPPLRAHRPRRRPGPRPPRPLPRPDREGRRPRPPPLPDRPPLRPRPEPRRDLPLPVRPDPRRPRPHAAAACPCPAAPAAPPAAPRPAPPSGPHCTGPSRRAPPTRSGRAAPSPWCWPPATSASSPSPTCRTG